MRVLIFDDSFTGWVGHNATYNFAISDELARRNIPCLIFANQSVAQASNMPANVHPTFRYFAAITKLKGWPIPSKLQSPARLMVANARHYHDLKHNVDAQIGAAVEVKSSDVLIVSLHSPFTSFAYARWVSDLNRRGIHPKVVFIVHNNTVRVIRAELMALRAATHMKDVRFAAQNEALRQLCESKSDAKFFELPLPYVKDLSSPLSAKSAPTIFSYLGEANLTKGFDVLVSAIAQLTDLLDREKLKLVVQCYVREGGAISESAHNALIELAEKHPGLHIISEPLSPQDYENKVRETDVVLNPHRASAFGYARSGTFSEALASAKPVIAARGTFMAQEIEQYGAGLVFEDGSGDSLSQAIRIAADQITTLQKQSKAAQNHWLSIHNAGNFADILLHNLEVAQ